MLMRYARFVVRHPRVILLASLLATAIVATGVGRLRIDLDPEQHLPADDPYIAIDRKIRAEFGGKNFVAIAVLPATGDVWQPDVLRAVAALTDDMLIAPGAIRQNVISLSSPYVRVPRDVGGTLTAEPLMKTVPHDTAGVAALRDLYRGEPLFKGTVVSDDERAALVLADFYDDVSADVIASAVYQSVAAQRSPSVQIAVTGARIVEHAEHVLVSGQAYYFLAAVVTTLLVLWLAFGHVQGVILPATTALLSTVWAAGFMGFAGIPINPWTAAVPLIVTTVAAGHSAQMLKRYYEEWSALSDRAAAVIKATQRIGAVMLAAGGTAGCGFAALALLGIPTLTHFGLSVACGIFASVGLELTFMLALRVLWAPRRHVNGPLDAWVGSALRALEALVARHPRRIVIGFAAIVCAAVAGYPRLTTEINPSSQWSARTEVGRDLRIFQQHFPSTTTLTVLLEGAPGSMKTPAAVRLMIGLQEAMAAQPGVGRTSSIVDIVRRTHEVFVPEEAASGLPMDSASLGQLFFLAEGPGFERYVDRSYSRAVVSGYLNDEASGLTRAVLARLRAYLAENPPTTIQVRLAGGGGPTMLAINDHGVKGKLLNMAVAFAVIFAIASLLLRTVVGGAYVVAPLATASLLNLGAFAWLGIPFDIGGASIAAVGVGIGADCAIYWLYRLREEFRRSGAIEPALRRTIATTGRAVFFVALAISAGFGVYLIADFRPMQLAGLFMPLTMMTSCLTALTLLPALVLLGRPAFVFAPPAARCDAQRGLRPQPNGLGRHLQRI
jgi:hypothetical protein